MYNEKPMTAHEPLTKEVIRPGSDRTFGFVFVTVFTIVGLWPLIDGDPLRGWSLGLAFVLAILAGVTPSSLHPLNVLWTRFGLLLNRIVSPVVLGILFYLVITPTGLIFKLLGKDPLRLKWDASASSYWLDRDPPGPEPKTMSDQF